MCTNQSEIAGEVHRLQVRLREILEPYCPSCHKMNKRLAFRAVKQNKSVLGIVRITRFEAQNPIPNNWHWYLELLIKWDNGSVGRFAFSKYAYTNEQTEREGADGR